MYESYQADILVADLNSQDVFLNDPVRVNALQVLLVLEGSIDLSIDYVLFQASTNTVVTIMPTHITKVMKYSPNFKGRLMAVSRAFLEQSMMPNHSSSMIQYMKIRKNPTILLQESEIKTLDECMLRLRQTILQTSHHLQRLLIQNTLMGFFIEMGNIFSERKEYNTPPSLTRKEELFESFLRILYMYCKEQHVVSFYAEQLYITPQYLSLILKELTGRSANKWIDEALMQEAKILLKAPQATVQQVADALHFSDQSTFGKFFKKHAGMSPMEYRKNS
ncbi:helix-turn-helix transcriptional regulator [Parabacteroides sp. AGMB00274]|uniref:Helix-turn-helix transcriptional regulator n=1 Tax=Parabacteroides faecalis TaxID=2924040 RepID=A0ABT0C1F7_9BACT|nr:helix-turn-helix transcriptional regulator [Parabacteroides faecalis]MCI7286511.1 helix-turn-helix transcriptional regulator [Parabacteroides sp.]MCJ2380461.1 helix-turn-helix transcriptional regulator [Parabacteroides faecalis]MDD6952019.1 helix-turn-helix transcriptional regulator [Parabacteroides sp.]